LIAFLEYSSLGREVGSNRGHATTDTDIRWWWAFEMFLLSLVGFDGRGGKFNPHMMEFKVSPDLLISAKAVALTSLPILPQR
jgi:hypothetical protein